MVSFEGVAGRQALVALVVVGAVAVGGATLLSDGGDTGAAVEQVPEGVDTVVRLDMTITSDRATQLRAAVSGGALPGGAGNTSDIGRTFENRTGIDPGPAREIVLFSALNDSRARSTTYAGAIVHTDAATDTATRNIRTTVGGDYERRTIDGQTVYVPAEESSYWIGVLGEGQLVVGSEMAVRDTVAVTAGETPAFDGRLRTAYDDTRNGTVQFATTSPDVLLPPEVEFVSDIQLFRDLRTVGGAYYIDSGRTGVEVRLQANSRADARSVAQATNGTVSIAESYVENETTADAVESISVSQQGSTVTVRYEAPIEEFRRVLGYLYGVQAG
jgi:hypothetical protein